MRLNSIMFFLVVLSLNINTMTATLKNKNTYIYDLTNSLPKNYVTNGSVDYTKYIQDGLDKYQNVKFPNFAILINDVGLDIRSNSTLSFQKKSMLIKSPTKMETYCILRLWNVSNVKIMNPVLVGDFDKHLGTKGEWGFGIWAIGAKNIKIISPKISNFWGDGIAIGTGNKEQINQNILITNAEIKDCRRNGITIASGINIKIENPIISNIKGTAPMSGIDIEAHTQDIELKNIVINNPTTRSCGFFGILVVLKPLSSQLGKQVTITINRPVDYGAMYGFSVVGYDEDKTNKKRVNGKIKVNNPIWYNNKTALFLKGNNFEQGPVTIFKNIQIIKDQESIIDKKIIQKDVQELQSEYKNYKNIYIQ